MGMSGLAAMDGLAQGLGYLGGLQSSAPGQGHSSGSGMVAGHNGSLGAGMGPGLANGYRHGPSALSSGMSLPPAAPHAGPLGVSRQRLFVVLPKSLSEDALARLFRRFHGMEYCDLKKDRASGKSKGYAYINYSTPEAAAAALEQLNGIEFPPHSGHRIKVMYAEPLGLKGPPAWGMGRGSAAAMHAGHMHMPLPLPPPAHHLYPPTHHHQHLQPHMSANQRQYATNGHGVGAVAATMAGRSAGPTGSGGSASGSPASTGAMTSAAHSPSHSSPLTQRLSMAGHSGDLSAVQDGLAAAMTMGIAEASGASGLANDVGGLSLADIAVAGTHRIPSPVSAAAVARELMFNVA